MIIIYKCTYESGGDIILVGHQLLNNKNASIIKFEDDFSGIKLDLVRGVKTQK